MHRRVYIQCTGCVSGVVMAERPSCSTEKRSIESMKKIKEVGQLTRPKERTVERHCASPMTILITAEACRCVDGGSRETARAIRGRQVAREGNDLVPIGAVRVAVCRYIAIAARTTSAATPSTTVTVAACVVLLGHALQLEEPRKWVGLWQLAQKTPWWPSAHEASPPTLPPRQASLPHGQGTARLHLPDAGVRDV